jgi:hypothetical protein
MPVQCSKACLQQLHQQERRRSISETKSRRKAVEACLCSKAVTKAGLQQLQQRERERQGDRETERETENLTSGLIHGCTVSMDACMSA